MLCRIYKNQQELQQMLYFRVSDNILTCFPCGYRVCYALEHIPKVEKSKIKFVKVRLENKDNVRGKIKLPSCLNTMS
jgi:hypothetical protein